MSGSVTASDDLISDMDKAAAALLKVVGGATMDSGEPSDESQGFDTKARIEAFKAVTDYLAVRNKIRPKGSNPSGIDKYRSAIHGRTAGSNGSRRGRPSSAAQGDSDADAEE